ncbi:MAG: hypothetical protein ABSE73_08480 [Planctomycetota bacterium]
MTPQESITAALSRCPALETKSLEEFLDSFLDEGLETLAQMPSTPGQVMAAQFTHYVRSSVVLAECRRRDSAQAQRLGEIIMRLPPVRKRAKTNPQVRREAPDGANTSRPEAVAA